ncbi:MAG: hypothetical protein LBR15_00200 [Methanobrevibacter sp.]|jgi:hypothetical protein|nr:hypothetical protein [Candidatus Methanovirga australis]
MFSDDLEHLLNLFEENVIKNPDFDKIISDPQSYIESLSSSLDVMEKDMLNLLKDSHDGFIQLEESYGAIITYMKGLYELSKEEMDKEYEVLLSELVDNIGLVLKHIKTINTCTGKLIF